MTKQPSKGRLVRGIVKRAVPFASAAEAGVAAYNFLQDQLTQEPLTASPGDVDIQGLQNRMKTEQRPGQGTVRIQPGQGTVQVPKIVSQRTSQFFGKTFAGPKSTMQTKKVRLNTEKIMADVGDQQRGTPEKAMLKIQRHMPGGPLSMAVEHVGDLTHRMTHKLPLGYTGRAEVLEKTNKMIHSLDLPYGFKKETDEHIKSWSEYYKKDPKEYKETLDSLLKDYTEAHRNLPVYNAVQRLGRESAIAVGEGRYNKASSLLKSLRDIAEDKDKWEKAAREFDPEYEK